ncbi:MAG TPA: FAD-dependent oxidoreductase [Candidatus Sulfobium mesophilum]|nr:FAD-dependent oxidoreductase [Candidatus Sulfobium mesophilum]
MNSPSNDIMILGGGLTGLSAGCVLTRAGRRVEVFECESHVGGLSKTIEKDGFRFDIGGHRFFTKDRRIDSFVKGLMGEELISVSRTSKIYLRNKYFDYPLKPINAVFGLGIPVTCRIMADYGAEKIRGFIKTADNVSLEDWVVSNFGRTMFNIYFKEYSEKVWGIDCSRISAEWVAQRIKGLSLAKAVKNAFFRFSGKDLPTLADKFVYPRLGIGRISERLKEEIEKRGDVRTGTRVERLHHSGFRIERADLISRNGAAVRCGSEFVSSLPLTSLIRMLDPAPPRHVLDAASKLKFRDLVVVALMIDRRRVTDQTWIYIPERRIPFGRIHEPTNWSEQMAPEGKTILVAEFFSFKGDAIWNANDLTLTTIAAKNMARLGFISPHEVIGSAVVRAAKAYPLFEVGYSQLCDELYDYLGRFENLHIAGRAGMFRYYNMDHAIESGITTAEKIIGKSRDFEAERDDDGRLVFAGEEK